MIFTGVLTAGAFELARHEDTQIAYIEGTASGQFVTIVIKDNEGTVAHINQYEVVDGKYSAKFPVEGSGEFTYSVNDGENDVTSAALVKVETYPVSVDVVVADQTSGGKYITEASLVNAVANITNKYGDNETFKTILAFYDENNKLLDVKISSEYAVEFEKLSDKKTLEYGSVPENTVRIKAFAWENEATLVPAGGADTAEINDMIFGNDEQKIVVAFFGDSISHSGVQQKFIESYYKTKYPGREIVFLNKGINGDEANRIVSRFDWEAMNDEYGLSPAPDEATMMIGMNDINRALYPSGSDVNKEKEIAECLSSIEEVILLCKENNVTLTLVTPSLYDDDESFEKGAAANSVGANDALGKVGEGVKDLAEKYNLPLIDLHTATNNWTEAIRAIEPGVQAITGTDRIHPDNFGGFVMGYEVVKQQGNNPIVAEVDIDALGETVSAENAKVTNFKASTTSVSYTYKANSLPVAYNTNYKKAESYNIPVTEDINREIIRVTGLEDGVYTIKMNGTALTKTYTAEELRNGVNIAIDSNNPGQKQALLVDAKAQAKVNKEVAYRQIPSMETVIVRLKDVCKTGISSRKEVAAYLADPAKVEAFVTSDYIVNANAESFYRSNIAQYNELKPKQAELWAEIEALDAQANALAVTSEIEVVIEKQ